MNQELDLLLEAHGAGKGDDPREYFKLAKKLEAAGDPYHAATAFDRAYGLSPADEEIALAQHALLDRLTVRENGMVFRYIPAVRS